MADDIDIEEHDVLDNPRIKNILDLSSIKIEVPDSDDEDQCMQTDVGEESGVRNKSPLQSKQPSHKNHMVLGSKRMVDLIDYEDNPAILDFHFNQDNVDDDGKLQRFHADYEFNEKISIKQEPEDYHEEEIERHGSCIVLGSKPNRSALEKESHDVNSSFVMLEDWGPRLQRSNCYCENCEILFPTRNCLDAHNMATHSFLVAVSNDSESPAEPEPVQTNVSVNKAMKSTAKNLQYSKNSSLSDPSTSNDKSCNHCKQVFPSTTTLIKHLYTHLPAHTSSSNAETELSTEDDHDNDDALGESKDRLYFRCDVCFSHCKYSLYGHMRKYHGKSTFSSKKVHFSGDCKFCSSKFSSSKNLNRHIKQVHSQYYNLKPGSSKLAKSLKSKGTRQVKVNSVKSNNLPKMFGAYNAAGRHENIKNTKIRDHVISSKVKRIPNVVFTKKSKPVKDQTKLVYNGVSNPPVPKSVLFKCNKCPLHFTNCSEAVFHSYNCDKDADIWKCDVCSKSFGIRDKIIHEHQHLVSNSFAVHLIDKSVYARTLCQCPKCKIYYSEQEFWVHIKQGCGQPRSVPCKICNILIHVSSTQMHGKLHLNKNFAAKHLILIEFVPFENKDTVKEIISYKHKRKNLEGNNAPDAKKTKISAVREGVTNIFPKRKMRKVMYYCDNCKNFWTAPRVKTYHLTGKCEIRRKKSKTCKKCGLIHSSYHHDSFMHKNGGSIFDYTFIRVHDNKIINPMPSYPMCSECKIHFLNKKARVQHDCNTTDYKICEYCQKRFSVAASKLHITYHEYALRKAHNKTELINEAKWSMVKKTTSVIEKSSVLLPGAESSSGKSPPMPALLKNYKLWTQNILYSCEVCDIVCNSYDKMVEHSQDHFIKMESYDMTINNCEICDLQFDTTCLNEHRELHDKNTTLNKQVFKILKYNYMNLFSDNWFELFGTLPHAQIDQIVSQSIYVHDRNIRMRITRQGPPENTVYKCGRCNGYLTASLVGAHFEKSDCWPPRYRCKLCHLDFSMNVCLKEHETVCRTTQQTYREVVFNHIKDVAFNRGLQGAQQTVKSSIDITQIRSKGSIFRLYECEICKCCVTLKSKTNDHKCSKPSERSKCDKCDLFFKNSSLYRHRLLHNKLYKMSKRTIMTIPYNPASRQVLPKLYKCRCGLHFTSLQTAERHLTLCGPRNRISKENCSKCGLLFPTGVLVSHLCKHHSDDQRPEFEIENVAPKKKFHCSTAGVKRKTNSKITIHKCAQCDVCFLSYRSLSHHFEVNHKLLLVLKHCDQCNVNFTKHSMTKHVQLHHTLPKYTRGNVTIKVYRKDANPLNAESVTLEDVDVTSPKSTKIEDRNNYTRYLYQCRSCKIHFLSHNTCCVHYKKFHKERNNTVPDSEECVFCGLAFMQPSLVRHVTIHHEKMKLNREDLIVIPSGVYMKYCKDLYKCEVCKIHFVTHDAYAKHCYEGIHSVRKFACNLCGYDFSEISIKQHIKVHHNLQHLGRKDFNIITDNGFDGGQQSQLSEMNEVNMEEEDEKQYQDKKDQNSKIIVTNRLYRCRTCSVHFCKESHLIDHVSEASASGHNHNVAECQFCNLNFTQGKGIDLHINEHHEKLKLTNKEFLIIENENVDGAYANRYLYKCSECATHFVKEANAEQHDHTIGKCKCRACGLLFSSVELGDHKNVHHNLMEMSLNDFRFVIFSAKQKYHLPDSESSTVTNNAKKRKIVTMYKLSDKHKSTLNMSSYDNRLYLCKCGLHYLILNSLEKHIPRCNRKRSASVSKVTCEICGLLFSPRSIAIHQYVHHEHFDFKLEDLRVVNERDLKQCNVTHRFKSPVANECLDSGSTVGQKDTTEKEKPPSKTTEVLKSTETPLNLNDSSSVGCTDTTTQEEIQPKTAEGSKCTESVRPSKYSYTYSESYLSSLNIDKYSNQLYKCKVCEKHYISLDAGVRHFHGARGEPCATCGLVFSGHIMLKHYYVHHERLGLNLADFVIHNVSKNTDNLQCKNQLYKCDICDKHFFKFSSAHTHTDERCTMTCKEDLVCKTCGLKFSECSLKAHEIEHHIISKLKAEEINIIHYSGATRTTKSYDNTDVADNSSITNSKDFDEPGISTEKADEPGKLVAESETSSFRADLSLEDLDLHVGKLSTSDSLKITPRKDPIKLYKCGDCNVFYINQNTCYKHMLNHKELDTMDYIECKLCGLPFRIVTLQRHMIKHHKADFDLKNVLIEEYRSTKDNTPKIEIYYALDKIQSRLVSTTTDSKEVSEGKVDSTVDDVVICVDDDLVRERILAESAIKETANPIIDVTMSIITTEDDRHPSTDQVVSTSNRSVKDITDSAVHNTVSEIKVKDGSDHTVKQIVTETTVVDIINPSSEQADTDNDLEHVIIPTVDLAQ